MQVSKRNFSRPQNTDSALISDISNNFEYLDSMFDTFLGAEWGGFVEKDEDTVEKEKIYIDKRTKMQWLISTNGEFNKVEKVKFSLKNYVHQTNKIDTGVGLSGGGDLSVNRVLSLDPATGNKLGGIKVGNGLVIATDGTLVSLPPIGGLLFLTQPANPSTIFIGTAWEKIEGVYLKGTSGTQGANIKGGANNKLISIENLPVHNHTINDKKHSHYINQIEHNHTIPGHFHGTWGEAHHDMAPDGVYTNNRGHKGSGGGSDADNYKYKTTTNSAGVLSISSPLIICDGAKTDIDSTNNAGGAVIFNVEPIYYTIHIWKRTN